MPKVMYKSAEDFLQQQVARTLAAASGATPNYTTADGTPIRLEGRQAAATLDPVYQRANPAGAALYRYREAMPENSTAYKVGEGVRSWAEGAYRNPSAGGFLGTKGPVSGALAMGIPAALLGLGAGYVADKITGRKEPFWSTRAALGAGAAGAGLGAYTGHWRNKQAAFWKSDAFPEPDPQEMVLKALNSAQGLSFQQKNVFAQGIQHMSDSDAKRLLQAIMASGGFGIGAIIAKFLMGAGLGGTIMGGIAGGLVGNALAPRPQTDALGRRSLGNYDLFGRKLL